MWKSKKIWLMALLWWAAVGLFYVSQAAISVNQQGEIINWWFALQSGWGVAIFWLPTSILMLAFVERYPLDRQRLWRCLARYLVLIFAVVLFRGLYVFWGNWVVLHVIPGFEPWYDTDPALTVVLAHSFRNNFLTAWFLIGMAHALIYFERHQQAGVRVLQLEAALARAQLDALSAQLNPHFLFNALNSIAELVHHDANAADRMLIALSQLLRRSLDAAPAQTVRLQDELDLLRHYLDIESVRLGPRLQVQWQVAPDCLDVSVPVLILQPLVENAIVHAVAKRRTPGHLAISAWRTSTQLHLEVQDSGQENASSSTAPAATLDAVSTSRPSGVGLSNTRQRLQAMYGALHQFEWQQNTGHGTQVRITLPLGRARLTQPDAAQELANPAWVARTP